MHGGPVLVGVAEREILGILQVCRALLERVYVHEAEVLLVRGNDVTHGAHTEINVLRQDLDVLCYCSAGVEDVVQLAVHRLEALADHVRKGILVGVVALETEDTHGTHNEPRDLTGRRSHAGRHLMDLQKKSGKFFLLRLVSLGHYGQRLGDAARLRMLAAVPRAPRVTVTGDHRGQCHATQAGAAQSNLWPSRKSKQHAREPQACQRQRGCAATATQSGPAEPRCGCRHRSITVKVRGGCGKELPVRQHGHAQRRSSASLRHGRSPGGARPRP
mmetsp:Transcript_67878/g.176020  ORF Transcript_67878/g.176020 Transcript_67878/m.176020 type:complete len:274 (+) Transcript_67878:1449-2270(+)